MKTMKITAHNLPAAPAAASVPAAASRSGSGLAQAKNTTEAQFTARPVRISRFPEEAALFAYGRNATLPPPPQPSQIDEYV
jgi:hypothetical protein